MAVAESAASEKEEKTNFLREIEYIPNSAPVLLGIFLLAFRQKPKIVEVFRVWIFKNIVYSGTKYHIDPKYLKLCVS